MLVGKQPSGPSDPGLHLVQNQQHVVRIAQFAQAGQVIVVDWPDATFTLNGLDQYRHRVRVLGQGGLHHGQVVEADPYEALGVGGKAVADPGAGGGAQRHQGAPVESALGHQYFRRRDVLPGAVQPRDLQRALVRFRA